jgi:hypothetical protein
MYFAQTSVTGAVKHWQLANSIGVLAALDNPELIGRATCRGWDAAGLAWWELTVHGKELPGLWVIIDRVFWPA